MQAERTAEQKVEEAALRAETLAQLAEADRIDRMTAARRRMRVEEHRHEAERLVAAKREAFERAQARRLFAPKTSSLCLPCYAAYRANCAEPGACLAFTGDDRDPAEVLDHLANELDNGLTVNWFPQRSLGLAARTGSGGRW